MQGKHWRAVANFLPGKTEVQCLHRWTKVLNPNLTKGPWTAAVSDTLKSFSAITVNDPDCTLLICFYRRTSSS